MKSFAGCAFVDFGLSELRALRELLAGLALVVVILAALAQAVGRVGSAGQRQPFEAAQRRAIGGAYAANRLRKRGKDDDEGEPGEELP
jgi:hypothetical protein